MPRGLVQLAAGAYVAWSTVVDAPISSVSDDLESLLNLVGEHGDSRRQHLERLERLGQSVQDGEVAAAFLAFNRAGPGEVCLTADAIVRCYGPDSDAFVLHPSDIQPFTTSFAVPTGHPEHGRIYWVPWPPHQVPASLEGADLRAMVYAPDLSTDAHQADVPPR